MRLRFFTNRAAAELPSTRRNTPTGTMAVATPELTALDLANRPGNGGALHNVATVLIDLADDGELDDAALASLAARFPVAAGRRAGWIVERFTDVRLDALADAVSASVDDPSKRSARPPARRGRSALAGASQC